MQSSSCYSVKGKKKKVMCISYSGIKSNIKNYLTKKVPEIYQKKIKNYYSSINGNSFDIQFFFLGRCSHQNIEFVKNIYNSCRVCKTLFIIFD